MNKVLMGGALAVVIILMVMAVVRGREAAERATITIDDQSLTVRIADNPWERARGLSGMDAADVKAHGMLFIFPEDEPQDFWMKGMKLNLDVLWIHDNKIVGIEEHVPAPKPGEEPQRFSSEPIPVDMVLEFPAGSVAHFGILPGMSVKIELP